MIIKSTQAIVELRRYTYDANANFKKKLQQRELVVVPFEYGPRCYIKAIKRAGHSPLRMDPLGGFDDRRSFAPSQKNWTAGYVTPFSGEVDKKIEDRKKRIFELDANAVIVVVK